MDEDPSNEAYVLSLLEGYGNDEAEAMDTEPVPSAGDWRDKYIAWMDQGEPPGPIRGQTHCQDGQVVHPHRRRAVQARRIGRPAAMRAHP
jgi:hypothetical protein